MVQWLGPLFPKAGGPRFNPWSGNEGPTCQRSHRLQRRSQISCAAAKTQGSQINTKKNKKKERKKSTERNKEAEGGDKTNTKGPVPEPPQPQPHGPTRRQEDSCRRKCLFPWFRGAFRALCTNKMQKPSPLETYPKCVDM